MSQEQNGILPLYKQVVSAFAKTTNKTSHIGLLFDKFPNGWNEKYQLEDNKKKYFLDEIIKDYIESKPTLTTNLASALRKQTALLDHMNGLQIIAKTDWRLVIGLGTSHPYETGFIWHRTLSVPYLPGSSVKGMLRAWATQWSDTTTQQEVTRLFGADQGDAECGALIVFDALPVIPPKLEIDILNPHYSEYYQNPANPPADYLSPIPVFFLTVQPEQAFTFSLAPRAGFYRNQSSLSAHNAVEDLETAKQLLIKALAYLGLGAKTAVGYGQLLAAETASEWLEKTIEALKQDKDLKGLRIEDLWKKSLSEKYLTAPQLLKPAILDLIKSKWKELGLSWAQPKGKSAEAAIRNFLK